MRTDVSYTRVGQEEYSVDGDKQNMKTLIMIIAIIIIIKIK